MTRVTRRLLLLGVTFLPGWTVAQRPATRLISAFVSRDPAARLKGLIRDPESARAIGGLYLRQHPGEADPTILTRHLLSSLELDAGRIGAESDARLRDRLRFLMRADFAEGRTARVDGWILSRTEARLCALWA